MGNVSRATAFWVISVDLLLTVETLFLVINISLKVELCVNRYSNDLPFASKLLY
jgi:hypothetical protein